MLGLHIIETVTHDRQWFFWGYSLAFSDGANAFIGDLSELDPSESDIHLTQFSEYFALKGVLEQPAGRIPALLFAIFQCMFACITYAESLVPPLLPNPPNLVLLSPLVPSLNVAVSDPPSFSFSFGPQLYTILLPAGHGTPTDGPTFSAVSILREALPFTLVRVLRPSLFPSTSASAAVMVPNVLPTSLTTRPTSSLEQCSSGSAGSVSTVDLLSLPTSVLFRLASLPTLLPLSVVSPGCFGCANF